MHHFISAKQFSNPDQLHNWLDVCWRTSWSVLNIRGRTLATMFFEPSTRTRFSFEKAMHNLGGKVISASENLSTAKGETLEDTIQTMGVYASVIALRHPSVGAAERAAKVSRVPIINAGDGSGEHPTQALLDCLTIFERFRGIKDQKVLVVGDLKHGRTVHSLINLLTLFPDVKIMTAAPLGLGLPGNINDWLHDTGRHLGDHQSLEWALKEGPDVVYMTRLQKERFDDPRCPSIRMQKDGRVWEENVPWSDFCLNPDLLAKLKNEAIVLHPLPRNEEIHPDCDKDGRCLYMDKQLRNGVKVRMKLLYDMFDDKVGYNSL